MSDTAAPWWADVQHLRPREDRETRFPRRVRGAQHHVAAVVTLEREPDALPPADEPAARTHVGADEPAVAPRADEPAAPALWDDALEQAFADAPSWADEDWMLPKGADRIENGRRTIEIRGQVDRIHGFTAPDDTKVATRTGRRRPARRPAERLAGHPDRVALWAFLLGVLLILIAVFSHPGDAGAAVHAASQHAALAAH